MVSANKSDGGGDDRNQWWRWALASATQFLWGMSSYRKGYVGDSRLMPFKAFAVSSLFVGSATTAAFAALQANGVHKVEDLVQIGATVRSGLGIPSRANDEKSSR